MYDIVALILLLFLLGWNISYLFWINRYMKKHGIKDINKTTGKHGDYANRLFLRMMFFWWYDLYIKIKEKK